jgi:asparagine synthase (glutamine-hydrolysing)
MCGISGQYCLNSTKPDTKLLTEMSAKLYHRGPDTFGNYLDDKVGLSHRRLGIIDLSENAHQPMTNEDNTIQLTYNGEIYNAPFLRDELIKKGHIFKSRSDTEVIVHAYEEWGVNCIDKFNGMWAFALWDIKKQSLFCSRDRFGIKPFYYTFTGDSFLFASEIKALLVHPDVGKLPNDETVSMFLAYGIQDYSELTMFEGIYQLKPSHNMILNDVKIFQQYKYWDLKITSDVKIKYFDQHEDEINRIFGNLLNQSIKLHLQSDVPIGTCLSGGIDSSTIVKFIECMGIKDQKTFSAIFLDYEKYDESNYMLDVLKDTNIDYNLTTPYPEDLIKNIKNLIYIQDEPFGSLSIYAQYCVMREASGKVKVLLDGQGADEIMAGYIGYQYSYMLDLLSELHIYTAIKELFFNLKYHYNYLKYSRSQIKIRGKRRNLLKIFPKNPINRYAGKFNNILHDEIFYNNLPALLHYEDRNSMAFSIECRVPYLDISIVRFLSVMPYNQKIKNGMSKIILRNTTKGLIPESVRNRTDKMGFATPEEQWMSKELSGYIFNIFQSDSFKNRKYWDWVKVNKEYCLNFIGKQLPYSHEFWRIACTELWLREFFDKR